MRSYLVSFVVAAAALTLVACEAEVKVDENVDTTATPMTDTTTMTTPLDTSTVVTLDTTATTTTDAGTTTTTTDATTGGSTTTSTTGATTTTTTTTPSTSSTTTTPSTSTTTTPPPTSTTTTPPPSTPPPSTPPPSTPPTGSTGEGKAIFTAQKCNTCHSVTGEGITKSMASSKAPDLGTSDRSASVIVAYLKQTENINGKKHVKKWAGSDADLQTLAAWIASH